MQQVQTSVCAKATTPKPVGCKPGNKRVSGKCYLCSPGTYSSDGKTCRLASYPAGPEILCRAQGFLAAAGQIQSCWAYGIPAVCDRAR